ncbi:MAG: 2-phospho-L-lactate guanylyltransferase, partial [Actinomycetota bacterium]
MHTPTTAIIPLRRPGAGKSRLAEVLSAAARARLATAMFGDVVAAARASSIDQVVAAADGPAAAEAASAAGAQAMLDPPDADGLNGVIAAALARVRADADVLIVAAGLPRVTADDLEAVLATPAPVVIAATCGGGTGALLLRSGARLPTAYGPGSARRHREIAASMGLEVAEVDRDGLHYDVDTWTDLVALHAAELGPRTAGVLPTLLGGD